MPSDQPMKWLGLPAIAMISRLLCRELTLQNEYLRLENKILKSKIKERIRFTDDERRSLVDAALAMSKQLMESVVDIVKPATLHSSNPAGRQHPESRTVSGGRDCTNLADDMIFWRRLCSQSVERVVQPDHAFPQSRYAVKG
jgi:hypothetical protein